MIRLHADGWNAKSIAGYLDVSRKTVHEILQRFAQEQFAGLEDKSHARASLRKVDIETIQEIKKLSENPLLERIASARPLSRWASSFPVPPVAVIFPSTGTCIISRMPRRPRPKAEMPFRPNEGIRYGAWIYVTWICTV